MTRSAQRAWCVLRRPLRVRAPLANKRRKHVLGFPRFWPLVLTSHTSAAGSAAQGKVDNGPKLRSSGPVAEEMPMAF
jgi:hypothetical protein